MGPYEQAVAVLSDAITDYIRKAKRRGTIGMSKACLMQCIPTRGVYLPNANAFQRAFEDAIVAAKAGKFVY